LRDRDDLDARVVGDQREVGVKRRGGLADRAAHVVEGRLVVGLHRVLDRGDVLHGGDDLLGGVVALPDGPGLGGVRDDLPAVAVLFEQQVDQAHMRAPEAGHHRRLAHQSAVVEIGAFDVGEVL